MVKQLNTFQKQSKQKQPDEIDEVKCFQATTVRVSSADQKDNVESDDRETLFVKQLLYQRNVAHNDDLVKQIRKYVIMYGDVDRFKYLLDNDHNEKNKLNAYIAATKALTESKEKFSPRINQMIASKPNNLSHVAQNDSQLRMSVLNGKSSFIKRHVHLKPAHLSNKISMK